MASFVLMSARVSVLLFAFLSSYLARRAQGARGRAAASAAPSEADGEAPSAERPA